MGQVLWNVYEIANDQGIDLIELDYWFENSVA